MPPGPAPRAHDIIGRRLGRYEVLSLLASGGMASVYVGRAIGVAGFERLVAIKVLHPHLAYEEEFIHMFLDEARLAARIRHHNVVATTDISDTEGDGFFIVMDYIEGAHLGSLLAAAGRSGRRISRAVVARIILDGLAGLGAAHQLRDDQGDRLELVHRDVSPQNLMVGADGIARLTDFGVAKAEKRLTSTKAGQLKGKLAYMSPEQASSGFADQRSDLFSMGVILWEALTGRRLFRGENNAATLSKILMEPIPPVSSFAPDATAFDPVVTRALERDADARFQNAEEFALAIRGALAEGGSVAEANQVGVVVRELLGDRLKEQAGEVRGAIDRAGRSVSEPTMPVRAGEATGAHPLWDGSRAAAQTTPGRPFKPAPEQGSRKRLAAAVGVSLLVLGLAVGGGLWLARSGEPSDEVAGTPNGTLESPMPTESAPGTDEPSGLGASPTPTSSPLPSPVEPAPVEPPVAPSALGMDLPTAMNPASAGVRPITMRRPPRGMDTQMRPAMVTMTRPTPQAEPSPMVTPPSMATMAAPPVMVAPSMTPVAAPNPYRQ